MQRKTRFTLAAIVLSSALTVSALPGDLGAAMAAAEKPPVNVSSKKQTQATLTRAQFLKQVVDALKLPKKDQKGSAFKDTGKHWVETQGYIDAAIKAGIIDKTSKYFYPNTAITREAAASMLARAVRTKHPLPAANHVPPYLDAGQINKAFYHDINWATWLGLITPDSNSRLSPKKALTQTEQKQLMQRLNTLLQNLAKQKTLPAPPIIPLSQIKPGMEGVVHTVIEGNKIESFTVKVIDVLKGEGEGGGDIILVRASGELLKRSYGVASGMSGSPVYFNGKIAGALAYGFTDPMLAGLTPIEAMLNGAPVKPNATSLALKQPLQIDGVSYKKVQISATAPKTGQKTAPSTLLGYTLPTPLFVSGLGTKTFNALQEQLQQKGYTLLNASPYSGQPASMKALGRPLQPGDAMGLVLASGDLRSYGIGTVTYVDNNRLWAFGHPALWTGETNALLTEAWITTVIRGAGDGLISPFKYGIPGKAVGTITEDRAAAVAGIIGKTPQLVPVNVKTKDLDRNREHTLKTSIIPNQDILPSYAAITAAEGIYRAIDRLGDTRGTNRFTVQVETAEFGTITRTDMQYDSFDTAYAAYATLLELMNILTNNPYQPVTIKQISVNSEVSKNNTTARIVNAQLKHPDLAIKPGDFIVFSITLQPWRAQPVTLDVPVKIPEDLAPGAYEVRILSSQNDFFFRPLNGSGEEPQSLQEMIDDFISAPKGNDIIVDLYPLGTEPGAEAPEMENPGLDKPDSGEDEAIKPIRSTYSTRWAIQGEARKPLTILVSAGSDVPGEEPVPTP